MAVTQGHGNPDWMRDEIILALDLYFECGRSIPSESDDRVIKLSQLLRSMPYHGDAIRNASFRNPAGVSFKLQNLRSVATGKGLPNTAKMDKTVWQEFGSSPSKTRNAADLIRKGIQLGEESIKDKGEPLDDDETFAEGRVVTQVHKNRERNRSVRSKLIASRTKADRLFCEICEKRPLLVDEDVALAMFEAHHVEPLSLSSTFKTSLKDMAFLCADCHRLTHKLIAKNKRWLGLLEIRTALGYRV